MIHLQRAVVPGKNTWCAVYLGGVFKIDIQVTNDQLICSVDRYTKRADRSW